MAEKLTKKEKGFADDFLETGNGTQSALKNYDTTSENVAASIASQNLRKQKVQDYLESKAEVAASVIFELCTKANNESVKLNAGKDILDRAGHKPVEKKDITSDGKSINSILVKFIDGKDNRDSDRV